MSYYIATEVEGQFGDALERTIEAHKAFEAENKIGTLLPCNVMVRETETGAVEVAAVDPVTQAPR